MRRIARPLAIIPLSLCVLCLAGEAARAGHPVQIGAKNDTESALLAEIAAELVRSALDIPFLLPNLANSPAAWQALQNGAIDAYPESLAALAAEILRDPDLRTLDQLRPALAKYHVRMTGPVGAGDFVLLYRADLPDRAPASALVLLRMQGLLAPEDVRQMIARSRTDGVPGSAIAADFLRAKLRASSAAPPASRRHAANPWSLAGLLAATLGILAVQRWRPIVRRGKGDSFAGKRR